MAKPDYATLQFPAPPAHRPYVLLNMVMSVDGKIVLGETEQGIGSKVDQRLMRELRVGADVVLNGAQTLRKSGTSPRLGGFEELEAMRRARGMTRFPIAAVVSSTGELPLDRAFFTAEDFRAVVYLGEEAPRGRREAIEATGREVVTLPLERRFETMLLHMKVDLGASVLLLEGGPTVNAALFAIDAIDELFFSVGALVIGGRETITPVEGMPFDAETAPRLSLVSAVSHEETDEVYLRYRVRR